MKNKLLITVISIIVFFCFFSCTKKKQSVSTQVGFYFPLYCNVNVLPITVKLNGDSQIIKACYPFTSSCGDPGAASFTVPSGNYTATANGGSITWTGSVTADSNQCSLYSLDCSGNINIVTTGTTTTTGTTSYYYANWTCNGSSQCTTDMGGPYGSIGPFCTNADAQAWGNKFIPGGYSVAGSPTYTISNAPTPKNGKCYQSGVDF